MLLSIHLRTVTPVLPPLVSLQLQLSQARALVSMLLSIHLLTVAPVLPLLGRHYDCLKHGRNHRQQPLVLGWWQGWCRGVQGASRRLLRLVARVVQGGAVVLVPECSVSSMLLSIHLLTVAPVLPLLGLPLRLC